MSAAEHTPDKLMEAGVSGIVMAGGESRRMGRDKSSLILGGMTLLERQIALMVGLGIDDILVSGRQTDHPAARYVPDIMSGKGPLEGLYTCFKQAQYENCLVTCVDMPLLPAAVLKQLIQQHLLEETDVTLLSHRGRTEPLLGVYRSSLWEKAGCLLAEGKSAVRALIGAVRIGTREFTGPEELLINCNTEEDYIRAITWFDSKAVSLLV